MRMCAEAIPVSTPEKHASKWKKTNKEGRPCTSKNNSPSKETYYEVITKCRSDCPNQSSTDVPLPYKLVYKLKCLGAQLPGESII